jgi:hypothetical protein
MTNQLSKIFRPWFEPTAESSVNSSSPLREVYFSKEKVASLTRKLEVSDLLLPAFIAVVTRQYFWGISNQNAAWMLTIVVTGFVWYIHLKHREKQACNRSWRFWLFLGLPLLFIYALNLPVPDTTFDVLNYHLVNAERALRGWPFIAGDFFPTIIQLNPAPDMVSAFFRHALGYRLGTIVNYLAMLWIVAIIDKFLRPYLHNRWLRWSAVLLIVSTEFLLYLLNFYLIDLLALPLLLEATYLALNFAELRKKNYAIIHIALFLGISVAFKITNLAFVVPIVMLCGWRAYFHRKELRVSYLALATVIFIAPLVPFSFFLYRQTGNPLFPLLNSFFKSPYLPHHNWDDPLHGPKKWWEIISWPILAVIYPERLSEMSGLVTGYTGRIAIAYVVSILGLATRGLNNGRLKAICFVTLLASLLWSITTGNGRYGLYLELLGGIVACGLLASVYQSQITAAKSGGKLLAVKAIMVVALFGGLLVIQSVIAYHHVYAHIFLRSSEGQTKLGLRAELRASIFEARNLLSDYSAAEYLSLKDRQKLNEVDVWVNSCYTTNGLQILLKPQAPIISVSDYLEVFDLLETKQSQQRLELTLASLHGKRMFTLVTEGRLADATRFVKRAGLEVGPITPIEMPFFSECISQPLSLIELRPKVRAATIAARASVDRQ